MFSHTVKPEYLIKTKTQDPTEQQILAAAKKLLESKEKVSVSDQKEPVGLDVIFAKAVEANQTVSMTTTPGLFLDLDAELSKPLAQQWRECADACGCTMQLTALNEAKSLGQVYALNTRDTNYQKNMLDKKNWSHLKMIVVTKELLEILPTIPVLSEERPRRFLAVYKPENGKMTPYVFTVPNKMTADLAKDFIANVEQALSLKRSPSPVLQ